MDIASSFISKPAYNKCMKKINDSIQIVANKYFATAVQEEKEETTKQNNLKVSGTSTTVEIAAYVAACVFNEGSSAFLTFMAEMGITSGPSAHQWANATDNLRINRADEKAALETKEGRMQRRQDQKEALDLLDDSNILYGPGIDDSV